MDDHPEISVIVPFFNQVDLLRLCLDAVMAQSIPVERFEVLAIDNGSTESFDDVKARHSRVRFLDESRPGSYAARNTGIRAARGTIIAFMDADCRPAPTWLERGVGRISQGTNCDIVAGHIQVDIFGQERPNAVEFYEMLMAFPQKYSIFQNLNGRISIRFGRCTKSFRLHRISQ